MVGEAGPVQGWKLHVSSVPTDAAEALRRIVPVLRASRVPFKVIHDEVALGLLNEGALGPTQIGKFATVYPPSDAAARRLAERLVEMTQGLRGPDVATDFRLGDVVYTRYGGFRPIVVRNRLGSRSLYIRGLDGRLLRDEYKIPCATPPGRTNPFTDLMRGGESRGCEPGANGGRRGRLLGPGFLLLDVLKSHPKGGVYRGLDLRSRESVAVRVVKEGRRWALADRLGRDMRTRLQHQARVHAALRGRVPIPETGEYFEAAGHGYLPLAHLHGRSLQEAVNAALRRGAWSAVRPERRRAILEHVAGTFEAVHLLHRAGFVHRDLSAQNVFIEDGGRVYLIDLELAHDLGDDAPPFGLGTPGFMSPQQESRLRPTVADDVHALGALILFVLTGLDPRRLTFAATRNRIRQWNALTSGTEVRLVETAARCLDERPWRRPSLDELRTAIAERRAIPACGRPARIRRDSSRERARDVRGALEGLMRLTLRDRASGLWLSEAFEDHDRGVHEGNGRYELRRSANRGVAGVLYVLGRLSRFGYRTEPSKEQACGAAHWLVRHRAAPDAGMPGLHFGEAGVAVALVEAIAGGLIERSPALETFIRRGLSGALDWPDLTHGAAGQGVAALYCGDRLADRSIAALASPCASYLVTRQRPAGYWVWPRGSMSKSRGVLTGFAHGVAGITYFLAEYAQRSGNSAAERAWRRGAEWLVDQAEPSGGALAWPINARGRERWAWWCHGSIGIALLFLRLFERTKETRFAEFAERALLAHPNRFLTPNLSQCHGYSGVGEAYLEAHRLLGGRRWKLRADSVLDGLRNLRRSEGGASVWCVENPHAVTADLMVGCGGIVHLLLRASMPRAPIGPPLLLDPVAA